jgi:hypothetical protein
MDPQAASPDFNFDGSSVWSRTFDKERNRNRAIRSAEYPPELRNPVLSRLKWYRYITTRVDLHDWPHHSCVPVCPEDGDAAEILLDLIQEPFAFGDADPVYFARSTTPG